MPSLTKSSSANSLSSQSSKPKSPPRKYDGIPPELQAAYQCLSLLMEKEMEKLGMTDPIPTIDAFLWEACKVGHESARDPANANPHVQNFLQILLGCLYDATAIHTYLYTVLIACVGYMYMGKLYGDPTCSWKEVRSLLRWFIKHAFPTVDHRSLLQELDAWHSEWSIWIEESKPKTALGLLQGIKHLLQKKCTE